MIDIILGFILKYILHMNVDKEYSMFFYCAISLLYLSSTQNKNKYSCVFHLFVLVFDVHINEYENLFSIFSSHCPIFFIIHNRFTNSDSKNTGDLKRSTTVFKYILFIYNFITPTFHIDTFKSITHVLSFVGKFNDNNDELPILFNYLFHFCTFVYHIWIIYSTKQFTNIQLYKNIINDLHEIIYDTHKMNNILNENNNTTINNDIISTINE